jgi:hypothetical protein
MLDNARWRGGLWTSPTGKGMVGDMGVLWGGEDIYQTADPKEDT